MLIQIYETTSPEEAAALGALGVDHIGVLVGDGTFPREQPIARARAIFAAVPTTARRSALCLSENRDAIRKIVEALAPDILHLGAAPERLSPTDLSQLKHAFPGVSLMRSIPVADLTSIALAETYDGVADMLLLDSYNPGDAQIGAVGAPHNWELDRQIVKRARLPVIVAGGLGPHNVAAAIRASRPAGVDSKSRTDKADGSHTKDLGQVRAFVLAARTAAAVLA